MADSDSAFVGSVINALPLDKMIAAPIQAMISAQVSASRAYADFLLSVCIQNGKAVAIEFDFDETLLDGTGKLQGVQSKRIQIPLMAALSHPNICIDEGTIDFELTVTQCSSSSSSNDAEGSLDGGAGWGPFKIQVHGKVAHRSEQTRKSDTSAKYSIHTTVKREPPPEALMKVIDFLTAAATQPVQLPSAQLRQGNDAEKALPADVQAHNAALLGHSSAPADAGQTDTGDADAGGESPSNPYVT